MSREIKFRAWNGKGMEYGGFSVHATAGEIIPLEGLTDITESSPLMQYTGFKDRDGRDIYEGDIISIHEGSRTYPVIWHEDLAGFGFPVTHEGGYKIPIGRYLNMLWQVPDHELKIIGNIHKNPEIFHD